MKTAVSIPDDLFEEAERLAEETGSSRSALYARALAAFVESHGGDHVTAAIDAVVDSVAQTRDSFMGRAAKNSISRNAW